MRDDNSSTCVPPDIFGYMVRASIVRLAQSAFILVKMSNSFYHLSYETKVGLI